MSVRAERTLVLMPGAVPAAETNTRRRLVFGLVALGAFLIVAAFGGAGLASPWCASCHAMRPFAVAQATTAHKSVACWRCHGAGADSYVQLRTRELGDMWPRFVATLGSASVSGAGDGMADAGCLRCHADVADRTVTAGGLRMRHSSCVGPGQACIDCHAGVGHGKATRSVRAASMDGCVTCHDGEKARAACDLCHAAKLPVERLAKGPWAVTHGPQWRITHGLGNLATCRSCHAADYCVRCHGISLPHPAGFPRTHGKAAQAKRDQCVKCHDATTFCEACHGIAMPHPAGFLPGHSKIAQGLTDPLCARCHLRDTCDSCHVSHTHPGSTDGTLGKLMLPAVPK
jgi:hypothetical protein